MEYIDVRRLTGPNLLSNKPGSILDVSCSDDEVESLIETWQQIVNPILEAVGWGNETTCYAKLTGGVSLAFTAPIDVLYAASELNEWTWKCIEAGITGSPTPNFNQSLAKIRQAIEAERNPALLALERSASERQVAFLWDDVEVSIGHGTGSETWPFRELPQQDNLNWKKYHDVPIGIVTGTNGKTTSVRLATFILQGTGKNVGTSCTDWIAVNDQIIERGDWSGPGGARNVLRQTNVDAAVLEAARGGLLRRGLGVEKADAALITNIAEDHLGDFGSRNLNELLNIKWIISRAVEQSGSLILNADDQLLVAKARDYPGKIIWFSLDENDNTVSEHLTDGGLAFVLGGDELLKLTAEKREVICKPADIPITLGGAARHNVSNSLAAAALTWCLGASITDISNGLKGMTQHDNPGRCNIYDIQEFKVLVDFAHNPHAMLALFDMAAALPANRRLLAFGQAGDRPDELIRELARGAWSIGLDEVIVSELEIYHRGRNHGEVFEIIQDELTRCGAHKNQLRHFELEMDTLDAALEWARPGDLIIMLALGESVAIQEKLEILSNRSAT